MPLLNVDDHNFDLNSYIFYIFSVSFYIYIYIGILGEISDIIYGNEIRDDGHPFSPMGWGGTAVLSPFMIPTSGR